MPIRNERTSAKLSVDASKRSKAAKRAWETMNSAPYRAARTARMSQEALRTWAMEKGYHCAFLDAPSGHPRTGIVDAVLVRVGKSNPDVLELHLVQLKGGGAGLTPIERTRLVAATETIRVGAAVAMWDRNAMAVDFIASLDFNKSAPLQRTRKKERS